MYGLNLLNFASGELAWCGKWDVIERYTLGSDHFPILSMFDTVLQVENERTVREFNFHKAENCWQQVRERQ